MNGNNSQSVEGFIKALGHPRKKDLAGMLLAEEVATPQECVDAGFQRITVLEMVRSIRGDVEGMEEFEMEWPRDEEVVATAAPVEEVVEEVAAAETAAPVAETTGEVAAPVAETTGEVAAPVAETAAPVVEKTVAPAAPVAETAAPVAPEAQG